ncbi:response regulator [Candidatus Magnetomonas plexicatena]|uniref:response regulator n=1 Tax=Candidatus Magnetomonas plexicatena TaxID=2552947 RepID=UPI0011047B50|nr:hybrid sensor histidine kinase/response regulator [Nitrospirales bacterium LBB_01]
MDININKLSELSETRVMVVEDEWIIATNLQNVLEDMGLTVTGVILSGEEALRRAEDNRPDVVLMDILLHGKMDGIETAEKLRELYDIPVVYLTSHTDEHTFQRAKGSGPFGYLVKPFERTELRYAIEMAVYKHRMERELREKSRQLEELNKSLKLKVKEEVERGRHREHMLIQQSKLAAMGEMMFNIAHHWRQPLNIIGLLIQDLDEASTFGEINDEYVKKMSSDTMEQLNLMSKTISDFSNFCRPSDTKIVFDIKEALDNVVALVKSQLENNQIDIITRKADGSGFKPNSYMTEGYPGEFKQVILSILNNAKDAIFSKRVSGSCLHGENGEIIIEFSEKEDSLCVSIKDNGEGISDSVRDRIFEPYFTTKSDGIGIGLYMSKLIIESYMNGKLYVSSTDAGAMFTVQLQRQTQ